MPVMTAVAWPTSIDEAVAALAATEDAEPLAGGTDFCVEVNFGHRRPRSVVCLRRVSELKGCETFGGQVTIGAGTTYSELMESVADRLPALAAAARTVGSPQIRNAGTLGGNLATASPAGDTLPLLVALDARVHLRGPAGERTLGIGELITGVKRTVLEPSELIVAVSVPMVRGPQQFLKVGTRNAMVISIASAALVVDLDRRAVRCGLGSVGPVPLRARAAEEFIAGEIDWEELSAPAKAVSKFGEVAAGECSPITDHRGTADYRRAAVKVIVSRALRRSLNRVL